MISRNILNLSFNGLCLYDPQREKEKKKEKIRLD